MPYDANPDKEQYLIKKRTPQEIDLHWSPLSYLSARCEPITSTCLSNVARSSADAASRTLYGRGLANECVIVAGEPVSRRTLSDNVAASSRSCVTRTAKS